MDPRYENGTKVYWERLKDKQDWWWIVRQMTISCLMDGGGVTSLWTLMSVCKSIGRW